MNKFGVFFALSSALSYGLLSYLVSWNPEKIPVTQLIFLRGALGLLVLIPFCYKKIPIYWSKNSGLLWTRALSGCAGLYCYFYILQGTTAANANVLFSSAPIFVTAFSWFILKEKISKTEGIGIGLIVFGNFLLYIPNKSSMPLWVWSLGSLGALFASVAFLALGPASKKFSAPLIVTGFSFSITISSLLTPSTEWVSLAEHWKFLFTVSVLGVVSQILGTASYIYLKGAVATALGRSSILFSGFFDYALGGIVLHLLEVVSYSLTTLGIVVTQKKSKS
ncbi:MAG: DMT family transporter [Oligoflexia bacterium]|nr:DMT family transporter [Oligoflexia bacterium]